MSSQLSHEPPQQTPIEEDISRAGAYSDAEAGASPTIKTERQRQKQRVDGPFSDGEDEESSDEADGNRGSYPPTNDEAEESRRVEENLRKWEMAERQRRKAARDSTSTVVSTSLVGDVAKRASLLWPGKQRSRPPVQGVGTHHIVPMSDEGMAMDEIENDTLGVTTPDPENPFKTPNASTVSLNNPGDSAIMTEASASTAQRLSDSLTTPTKASFGQPRSHPPPKPLDLPEPRAPPPHTGAPHTNQPPEPIPPPTITADVHEEELPEKRWWTDWLCGCREREDNQAARTNPFE